MTTNRRVLRSNTLEPPTKRTKLNNDENMLLVQWTKSEYRNFKDEHGVPANAKYKDVAKNILERSFRVI